MMSVSVCVSVLWTFSFLLPPLGPPPQALRNVGLMSVRVRYRLTNYCPSSLHPSIPPSPLSDLSFFTSPPVLSSTLRPCALAPCSPVSCCCVYTCCRDWNRGEDKQRGSESRSEKNTKRRRETLTCPLRLYECLELEVASAWDLFPLFFLWGPVTDDRSLSYNQHEVRDEPDWDHRGGG